MSIYLDHCVDFVQVQLFQFVHVSFVIVQQVYQKADNLDGRKIMKDVLALFAVAFRGLIWNCETISFWRG